MLKPFVLRFFVTFFTLSLWSVHAEPLKVSVSLPPLHSLVSQIGEGVFEPSLIYSLDQSPHSSALKPSQLKQVIDADLLIWVDESLEQSLGRIVDQRSIDGDVLQLFDEQGRHGYEHGLRLLENRPNLFAQSERLHDDHESHDEHADHDDHESHDEHADHDEHESHEDHADHQEQRNHGHDHGKIDPHFWLDPMNAIAFSKDVTQRLIALDPDNQARYTANLKNLVVDLNLLNQQLHQAMAYVRSVPFIVFHDGFQYFESAYQLRGIGAIVLVPDQPPGPKTLSQLIEVAKQYSVKCLFTEPQYDARYLQVIEGKLPMASLGVIDTLGSQLEPGANLYFDLLTQLSVSMVDCLESINE